MPITTVPRYVNKFTSIDGSTISVTFPLNMYEYESQQGLRAPAATIAGADYGHDYLGYAAGSKEFAVESVRFLVVNTTVATLEDTLSTIRADCHRIGLGKLWVTDANGVNRWAYARLTSMPTFRVATGAIHHVPVTLTFRRQSNWFASAATTGTNTVGSGESPKAVTINNPGNARVKDIVFRLRANGSAGITNPSLTNGTNGYSIATTRDSASANSEIRIDTARMAVEYSNDNGSSYADDFDLVTLGSEQVGIMALEPGDNAFTVVCGGTPDFDLEWSFYASDE